LDQARRLKVEGRREGSLIEDMTNSRIDED